MTPAPHKRAPHKRAPRKRAAETRGRRAETLAIWMLRLKGYHILAHRLRTPLGEIDIVARRGNTVAIVEVKARATRDDAVASLSPHQQQRLAAAAAWLPNWKPALAGLDVRLDIVAVAPRKMPLHIRNAWTA